MNSELELALKNVKNEEIIPECVNCTGDAFLKKILEDLPESLQKGVISSACVKNQINIHVKKDIFNEMAVELHQKYSKYVESFHASDERSIHGRFRLYLVLSVHRDQFITVSVDIDPAHPSYVSLTPSIYALNWYEREIKEMFGITPEGHPDLRPLVLYDTWPTDQYPLRKEFAWNTKVPKSPNVYPFRHVEGDGVYEIPVGPVHAGIIEPGHFRFSVAGEPIVNLEIRLGYVHKGIEKLSENMTYEKGVALAERISGDNSFAHAIAYCQAVESCASTELPSRAKYLRTIYLELERLYNLFRDVAGFSLVTAFNVGAAHCYIVQERLMQLNDYLTGSRFLRGVACIGGVKKDLNSSDAAKIKEELKKAEQDLMDVCELTLNLPSLLDRTQTTGIVTTAIARDMNFVGPVGRASGLVRDVRKDHPYAAYKDLEFKQINQPNGDVQARYLTKALEIVESIKILHQALDKLPEGAIRCEIKIPSGKIGLSVVETPRGDAIHWVMSGEGKPFRHKIRDPSFYNWLAIELAAVGGNGNIVPDFPLINKSMNLSYSGNDL